VLLTGQAGRVLKPERVTYRDARADDADEIAALWAAANRARGAYVSETSVDVVRERIGAAGAIGKIAEEQGRVVGVAILSPAREDGGRGEPVPGRAHLNTVAVTPVRWRMGIARTILSLIIRHAREMNYVELQLYVDEVNERARRLYEADGWKMTGEAVHEEHATLLRYVRLL
jgi:ribosomal protein S18 acetylase RimI-like enzyme